MNTSWKDELQKKLTQTHGAQKGDALYHRYAPVFPTSYCEDCPVDVALIDIAQMENLSEEQALEIVFYVSARQNLHLRIFQYNAAIPLSDVLPLLENLDLRTIAERPYKIAAPHQTVWISDFTVAYAKEKRLDLEKIKSIFKEAFIKTRLGLCENDGFNKLVLGAQLSWREIIILRAYAKYLRQAGFRFSQMYIEQALANNPDISTDLIALFHAKFDPKLKSDTHIIELEKKIRLALETVSSLDEDRIIRRLLDLIKATLRTNYFQAQTSGLPKEYIAFKFESKAIPELPLPLPLYEVFVYSPRFEGIHLRSAKVARGGIRWSDRREDFRTEVLGLMKAQKVKNAVIVPSGAKGGFVLKAVPAQATRDILQKEVVTCYQSFIRSLLDITDNLKKGKVIPPKDVICYDDSDTYLVVAADKGTATFSDTANQISKDYEFWLGDAFASGGSVGYDHKKMGITAKGAWESVKRHFYEIGLNPEEVDFTAVGIGDMSGDVFGNGLIYSPHTKLLAAFDHRHIFLDPNPDAAASFQERQRLFQLPTSSWEDYNPALISKGGGVYKRTNKSIALSPEIKAALSIEENELTPSELMSAILKAPVDLLWNGGIGTYIKASTESHADVGDKANELCRVDGSELRCKIVGEGGNLGCTQLGRIEYALHGGLINTDFIDNSAGVDCSDHEVNIKIFLNNEVIQGKMTESQRNALLTDMTQEVSDLVLADNFNQALVMSFASFYAKDKIGLHQLYIKELENLQVINRRVEFLPDDKKLAERKTAGLGLTRPELAVLLAYTKIHIKNEILKSTIPEHPYLSHILKTAFPKILYERYGALLGQHSLYREIIATQLSNLIVNEMGITFVYTLQVETGATVAEILRAYTIASQVFGAAQLQQLIESLNFKISMATQYELLSHIRHLVNLATRWFLHHKKLNDETLLSMMQQFEKSVQHIQDVIPNLMGGATKAYLDSLTETFVKAGIPAETAHTIAATRALYASLNVTEVANNHQFDLIKTAELYFAIGEQFNLLWFRDRIASDKRHGYWDNLARISLREELDTIQKRLTVVIMPHVKKDKDVRAVTARWIKNQDRLITRWENILSMLYTSSSTDYAMFFIALRELAALIKSDETE